MGVIQACLTLWGSDYNRPWPACSQLNAGDSKGVSFEEGQSHVLGIIAVSDAEHS